MFVVANAGCTFDGACLIEHLKENGVTKFKWPEYIALLDALPRNAVGKQDRVSLREHFCAIELEKIGA